jgi:alginate O-acetyltransferase complex protein AlgJ
VIDTSTGARRPPDTARRRRGLPRRPVAALLALVFFFGPFGAFVLGQRPQAIENRPLADFPSLSDGWAFFPGFTAWATDHLPLRAEAVQGNAALSERLFDEPPSYRGDEGTTAGVPSGDSTAGDTGSGQGVEYPQVIEGEDGWLYFGGDVSNPCDPVRDVSDTLARWDRLGRAIEASGRRFVVTVAPDKSTLYPDALPDSYLGEDCAQDRRAEFWDALRTSPPTGYLDLRGPLEATERDGGIPVYRKLDTHWTPRGAAVFATALADVLTPALLSGSQVTETGPVSEPGDLAALMGQPAAEEFPGVALLRPGVSPVRRESLDLPDLPLTEPVTVTDRTTGVPLFQPPTLLLGDSFSNASRSALGTLFADLTLLHNGAAGEDPATVAGAVAAADVVVVEIVERTISSGRGALVEDAALEAIEQAVAANPR